MPSVCGAGQLACRVMLGGSEGSPERALLSPSGVPLVQPPLLVEPCSVAWTGSRIKRESHALCLWRCSPCPRAILGGLDGLAARQREPCSLLWCSAGAAPLGLGFRVAWTGSPERTLLSPLMFRRSSPPCLSSHPR
jgi:hypothetical protein